MYSRALIIRDALGFRLFSVYTGDALWCKTCQALNFVYATTVYHGMFVAISTYASSIYAGVQPESLSTGIFVRFDGGALLGISPLIEASKYF